MEWKLKPIARFIHGSLTGSAATGCWIVLFLQSCVSVQELTLRDLEVTSYNDVTVSTIGGKRLQIAQGDFKILRDADSSLVLRGIATDVSTGNIGNRIVVRLPERTIVLIESSESTYIAPVLIIGFLIMMARFGAAF